MPWLMLPPRWPKLVPGPSYPDTRGHESLTHCFCRRAGARGQRPAARAGEKPVKKPPRPPRTVSHAAGVGMPVPEPGIGWADVIVCVEVTLTQPGARQGSALSRLHFCLPADPSRLHRTRDRIRDYLQLYCADQDVIDDLVLGIDEACANVVRHSESPDLEIAIGFRKNDLYVDVNDRGKGFDVESFDPQSPPDVTEIGGRGLFIMAKISDSLSLRRDNGIKVRMVKEAVLREHPRE